MEKSSIFSNIEIYGTDIHSEHNLGCRKNNPVCVDSVPLGNFDRKIVHFSIVRVTLANGPFGPRKISKINIVYLF